MPFWLNNMLAQVIPRGWVNSRPFWLRKFKTCGRRMYAVIITLNCNMGLRPRNEDGDDGRPTTKQTNKQYANTKRNKQTSKQSHLPNTTNPPGNWLKAPLCGNCVEIIIPTHHEIPRELVESSAVWKTVWKVEFQNTTKSPRELVEAPLCGKRCGNHISKTPQHPTGNWLKAPLR